MTPEDDRLLEALASLTSIAPDLQREARVRARCHAELSRRASRPLPRRIAFGGRLFDLAAASVLIAYLAAVFLAAARLGGSF